VSKHLKDGGEEPAPLDLLNRIPGPGIGKKFWQFKNIAPNQAELLLYGEIKSEHCWWDDWFGGSGVYADEFVQDLRDLGNVSQITCRINSIGGDIFAAIAIYTQLKTHAARIVCIVDGLAASAATLIVMAADEIQMPIGAMQMIHDPLACLCGIYNADELAKNVDTLNTIKESIVAIYADRTGLKADEIAAMMSTETWLTTAQAVKLGFCDTTLASRVENMEMKGRILYMNGTEHDLSQFKNVPPEQLIMDAIANHNASSGIVTEFVALAKKATGKPDPDETDNPDQDPETPEEDDKNKGKKGKKGKSKDCPTDEEEEIDDDDADGDGDGKDDKKDKDKKAKNTMRRLVNRYPKLTAMIVTQAKAEERKRIQDIDAIAGQVDPKMVLKAKYEDATMTAEALAFAQLQSSQAKGSAFLSKFQADTTAAKEIGSDPTGSNFSGETKDQERATIGEYIAKAANKILSKGGKR
jgi:ATP-dependent protease ClpP protease subunit